MRNDRTAAKVIVYNGRYYSSKKRGRYYSAFYLSGAKLFLLSDILGPAKIIKALEAKGKHCHVITVNISMHPNK